MPMLPAPSSVLNPITEDERNQVRDFAGYPVDAAVPFQDLPTQAASGLLDQVLAGLTDSQCDDLRDLYLTPLALLKADIISARSNMVAAKAATYMWNASEVADRTALFDQQRRYMCYFLGVPAGAGVTPLVPAVLIA